MSATSEVITARIPRYVLELNELVRRCGVSAQAHIVQLGSARTYGTIELGWRGACAQLRGLADALGVPASWRQPLEKGDFPPRRAISTPKVLGEIRIAGDEFEVVASVHLPNAVVDLNEGLQLLQFDDATFYYGTRDALLEAGAREAHHLPADGARKIKSSTYHWLREKRGELVPQWWSARCATGKILCCVETDAAAIERFREDLAERERFWCTYPAGAERVTNMRKALASAERAFTAKSDPDFAAFMAKATAVPKDDGKPEAR